MPGSMLILTWVGIIFVIILHRAKQGIYGIFMPSSVSRQRLFWALFQLPPAIIYKNI